jgi:hypothetical protein
MSVDSKIKQLLERLEGKKVVAEAEEMGAGSVSKDTTIKAANAGDTTAPMQGSSEHASHEDRDGEADENQGAKASASMAKAVAPAATGAGDAPNFKTVAKEETETEEEVVAEETEEEVVAEETEEVAETVVEAIDLSPIFGAELSEEFKEKATSIFEAAVVARVNHEVEKINAQLDEKFAEDVAEFQQQIVEKVDSYLNYVVENWMKENEVAIESGLRTEIAEDFIQGLQVLFKEHYIEVPEEKYDVLGDLEAKADELNTRLNSAISENVELKQQVVEMKRLAVIEEMSKDLADTEVSKLGKLLEGVKFDDEATYKQKVEVIKENYFPKKAAAPAVSAQPLVEDVESAAPTMAEDSTVAKYAQALSRSIKRK